MTIQIAIVFLIIAGTVVLFVTERLRVDLVALIAMALVLVTGIVSPYQGIAGFSNSATVTVGALFVLTAGLSRTGSVDRLGALVTEVFRRGFWVGLISVMIVVGILSAFINNTPVVAVFIPILLGVARETGFSVSRLLMPVSFASLFGGVCTLIGTSTNIIVNSIAEEKGLPSFSMFEFAPLGAIMFVAGSAYMLLVGTRLLPERRGSQGLVEDFALNEYLTEVTLLPHSLSVGSRIADAPLVHDLDLTILRIERGERRISLPGPDTVLIAGDVLLVRCSIDKIRSLQEREGVLFKAQAKWADDNVIADDHRLLEAVIEPNSRLVGSTLKNSRFKERYGATVLAIRHRGRLLQEKLSDTVLSAGDLLLVEIERGRIGGFRRSGDFIITSEMEVTEFRRNKAILAGVIVAGVVTAAALGFAPIVVTALIGAVAMVLTGVISIEEAYEAIEWKIIFLLAGALSLGVALDQSGAARLISEKMVGYVGAYGLVALVSAFYLLTSILTEAMTNNATAALLGPIAIATAATLGVSPVPFLIAITFAASSSFMTPVGYKTNTMIYGPGRYTFGDFLRVGTPLNIIFWILATIFIPVFWPF